MFASKYLEKHNKKELISTLPKPSTGITIVIPCFLEPDILKTLDALSLCALPACAIEVIVLINHSEAASERIREFNRKTKKELDIWITKNGKSGISYYAIGPIELRKKWAGAGLARKQGMDEAVYRFNTFNKKGGIIVSLDADTLIETNYFIEIEKHFQQHPKNVGATISFEHQKSDLSERHLKGILLYEKYLDYYKSALEYSGFPYSMFTIGSAFAVTADAYVKRGGMNRRQAGEDFYFLQGLTQIGEIGEIITTKVYPSARLSDRVPFGTGPVLQKWMDGKEDLNLTYNFKAFCDLKVLFDSKEKFYKSNEVLFQNLLATLPKPLAAFLNSDKFWTEINDLSKNCSTIQSYNSRFFQKFNAFKVLKYLNFAHENTYKKVDIFEQISLLENYKS